MASHVTQPGTATRITWFPLAVACCATAAAQPIELLKLPATNGGSVQDDRAVFSKINSTSFLGEAHAYRNDGGTWVFEQAFSSADAAIGDGFGASLAIDDDVVLAGALAKDEPVGIQAGAAYTFRRTGTTWTQEQKLLPADHAASDWFGYWVALDGDVAVVGSPNADGRPAAEALYSCDENGGTTVFDQTGNGHHGTNSGVTYSTFTKSPHAGNPRVRQSGAARSSRSLSAQSRPCAPASSRIWNRKM